MSIPPKARDVNPLVRQSLKLDGIPNIETRRPKGALGLFASPHRHRFTFRRTLNRPNLMSKNLPVSRPTLIDVCHWLCQCESLFNIRFKHWQSQWHTTHQSWIDRLLVFAAFVFSMPLLAEAAQPNFQDATQASGLAFVHVSPFTEERHTHLTFGSGIGWVDFDRDGWPDLFASQGAPFPEAEHKKFLVQGKTSDRLFRNLGQGQFTDVSEAAGLSDADYSMGVGVGDFNSDGFSDIYVSVFGRNRLLENNGDGTFREVAAQLGLDDPSFGASVTWADLDSDGNLDLFRLQLSGFGP